VTSLLRLSKATMQTGYRQKSTNGRRKKPLLRRGFFREPNPVLSWSEILIRIKSVEAKQRDHANMIQAEKHNWTAEETTLVHGLLQEAKSNNLTWSEALIRINSETKARGGSYTCTMGNLKYFRGRFKDLKPSYAPNRTWQPSLQALEHHQ
jgi:hypothetical protein